MTALRKEILKIEPGSEAKKGRHESENSLGLPLPSSGRALPCKSSRLRFLRSFAWLRHFVNFAAPGFPVRSLSRANLFIFSRF